MQTFMPYTSYKETAECLDYRRLGKQRVEAKQILIALGIDVGDHKGNKGSRWKNHPAVKMWKGCEASLCHYAIAMCNEWRYRGYNDTMLWQFVEAWQRLRSAGANMSFPAWVGDKEVHSSHRSNLLRKDANHYGFFGWPESPDMPYVWPVA